MNVIWIATDIFRRDHLRTYGNPVIETPPLDSLADGGTLFRRRCAGGFPTIPTRADHATGRWTMSLHGLGADAGGCDHAAEILARTATAPRPRSTPRSTCAAA